LSNNDQKTEIADWPVEPIPDSDRIFRRAHKQHFTNGEALPSAFDLKDGMSTDWEKYSTAQEARLRARKPFDNGVVGLNAADVRAIIPLKVGHSPDLTPIDWKGNPLPPNRAHTDVIGPNSTELRDKLSKIAQSAIAPETEL
jgi:hypothetical protein